MLPSRSIGRVVVLATALGAATTTGALACPPSLTVERAAGPASAGDDGAFVTVRAVHGCHPGTLALAGTAEGLVGGARRSIPLDLTPADTSGVYRVQRQWPREGVWVLRLTVTEGDGRATALVGVGPSGDIAVIREPGRRGQGYEVSDADVTAMLRRLAAR